MILQRSCSKKSQAFFYESFADPGGWQEENCVLESLCRFKVRANVKDPRRLTVESLRLLRTNYSVKSFYYSITNFKTRLQARGYQHNLTERKSALQKHEKVRNKIIPFFTTYHPALFN